MPQPGNGLRLLIILVTNKCWNVCLQQSVWEGMQILLYIFFILVRLQWQHSEVLCILTIPHTGGVFQVANQQSHSSPWCWAKSSHPCGDLVILVLHRSRLPCSPFSGSFLVTYPIALESVGQTGVRDKLQMNSRNLQRSTGIGFGPGSELGLLVQLWEENRARVAFPAHCFTGGCQMLLSLNFMCSENICHFG